MQQTKLPCVNNYGYYEIRLESIGGLGANLSGKILGELSIALGLNCSSFSSYGSEKRGSPVKAFIRYAGEGVPIRINSPVESPHLLGLFHERMAGKLPVMAGVTDKSTVVVNTALDPAAMRDMLKMHAGTLVCVDALGIAAEAKTRVNMVMLGALAKASNFIPIEALEKVVGDTLGAKYPQHLRGNLEGIRRGYEAAGSGQKFEPDGKYDCVEYKEFQSDWGYRNAPLGGVVPVYGSTVQNDLTASREGYIPVFKQESCIHCGLCDITCPDMVFQFARGEHKGKQRMLNKGPDYHHCKGCLRCCKICPTDALTTGNEREHDIAVTHVRNQDLIVKHMKFEDAGTNSYMESESATVNEIR
ncbi:MAG: 2-oxoacid:acceptor oxidoreductase family protein [Defluviitaleaceae bacterium]|nr:2-oxoacid:acceptor oxidoreductase family protein [Defluviitaleaceae bacterium]